VLKARWSPAERETLWLPGGGDDGGEGDSVMPLDIGTLLMKMRFEEEGVWFVEGEKGAVCFEGVVSGYGYRSGSRSSASRAGSGGCTAAAAVASKVYPDFETYNIRHSHLLRWDLELKVARETVRVKGEQLVVVLGAAVGAHGGLGGGKNKGKSGDVAAAAGWEWGEAGGDKEGSRWSWFCGRE